MKYEGIIQTDKAGNPKAYNKNAQVQFFKDHPDEMFVFTVELVGKPSANSRKYYFAEIVPKVREGLRQGGEILSADQTHQRLKMFCPSMRIEKEIKGKIQTIGYKSVGDKNFHQRDMDRLIEEAIIFAAETLDIVIDSPKS